MRPLLAILLTTLALAGTSPADTAITFPKIEVPNTTQGGARSPSAPFPLGNSTTPTSSTNQSLTAERDSAPLILSPTQNASATLSNSTLIQIPENLSAPKPPPPPPPAPPPPAKDKVRLGITPPSQVKPRDPVKDFRLPLFDKQNRLATFIEAASATANPRDTTQVSIADIRITQYQYRLQNSSPSGTSILTAPAATFYIQQQKIVGPSTILFKNEDLEATGSDWTYSHTGKKIIINQNTRVTYREKLPDLLK